MKIPVLAAALVGASAVNAQSANYPSDMPACGVTCGNNMLAQASSLNCNSSTDYSCLCNKPDFLYGLRDCANEYCQNNTAANIAIAWGNSFCASNSGTVTLPSATSTHTGNGSGATASTPTATTVVVATITSGSSTYVTTLSSTLYGAVPGATTSSGEVTITTTIVSTGTSSGSSYTTTLGTSTITSGRTTSGSTSSSSTLTTYTPTTTSSHRSSSSGAAPHMTAGPVAGLVVAGLAAALL
jgi:hypothetical protein